MVQPVADTEELPSTGVFSARARPVLLTDFERAMLESDRELPVQLDDGPPPPRPPLAVLVAHGAMLAVLMIPMILVVALGLSFAVR